MLDEVPLEGRQQYRTYLAEEFNAPLDPAEREQQRNEDWGLTPEQIAEAEESERRMAEWEGGG